MASRPVWQGHLRLSLVHCPVALHKATVDAREVRFHLLSPETHNRVKQAWKDAVTGDELSRRDLVRGYEVAKDDYVVVSDEELKALKLESTKVIDIERFVDSRTIDRLYWDQPYFLVPDGKTAAEPFAVIREAMAGQDKIALGRLVMANRERIVAVEPRDGGMLLTTLRSRYEVRDEDDLFEDIPEVRIDGRMIEIAQRIIAQSEAPFEPSEFRDRYEESLRDLVAKKAGGARPAQGRPAPAEESNVIDLMDALRRSLKAPPARATAAREPAARPKKTALKTPAKARREAGDAAATPRAAQARRGAAKHGRAAGSRASA
jgi:DNA end-binding protein Ku